MLHAGLDLSRKKLDVCLLSNRGVHLDQLAVPPDVDGLRGLARRIEEVHGEEVSAVIESMTGARLVHDTLEGEGWSVEIADALKVKGLAPLACKTDKESGLAPFTADVVVVFEGAGYTSPHGFVSLYSYCCLELFNHIVEGAEYRVCANETCDKLFVRQEGRAIHRQHRSKGVKYHSPECARAQAQREYRRRKRRTSVS
jgi:hypothetical protein